jgi:hypothetical protein
MKFNSYAYVEDCPILIKDMDEDRMTLAFANITKTFRKSEVPGEIQMTSFRTDSWMEDMTLYYFLSQVATMNLTFTHWFLGGEFKVEMHKATDALTGGEIGDDSWARIDDQPRQFCLVCQKTFERFPIFSRSAIYMMTEITSKITAKSVFDNIGKTFGDQAVPRLNTAGPVLSMYAKGARTEKTSIRNREVLKDVAEFEDPRNLIRQWYYTDAFTKAEALVYLGVIPDVVRMGWANHFFHTKEDMMTMGNRAPSTIVNTVDQFELDLYIETKDNSKCANSFEVSIVEVRNWVNPVKPVTLKISADKVIVSDDKDLFNTSIYREIPVYAGRGSIYGCLDNFIAIELNEVTKYHAEIAEPAKKS